MYLHSANIEIIWTKRFPIYIGAVLMSKVFSMKPLYIYVALV